MATKFTVKFTQEKETKNAMRYQEVTESDVTPAKIGSLYVQKSAFAEHGSVPESIEVTVTVK